ncbi:Hypothetical protein CINCED_3A010442 [Cinara cedri]|uniref:Uncharacterized protein n=1 Tax=Cinara cedri TaxID=506608 RepID=A0A5E4MQB0_9HEMI|nr:Hypothetical protein CINCED_3A010442 [Cinara cedri]
MARCFADCSFRTRTTVQPTSAKHSAFKFYQRGPIVPNNFEERSTLANDAFERKYMNFDENYSSPTIKKMIQFRDKRTMDNIVEAQLRQRRSCAARNLKSDSVFNPDSKTEDNSDHKSGDNIGKANRPAIKQCSTPTIENVPKKRFQPVNKTWMLKQCRDMRLSIDSKDVIRVPMAKRWTLLTEPKNSLDVKSDEFNWLAYSEEKISANCKYCIIFAKAGGINNRPLGPFVKTFFDAWKKAKQVIIQQTLYS